MKEINSTYHYLVSFSLKAGLKYPGLSCTVRTSNIEDSLNNLNFSQSKETGSNLTNETSFLSKWRFMNHLMEYYC